MFSQIVSDFYYTFKCYVFNLFLDPLSIFLLSLSLRWENHCKTDKSMREEVEVFIFLRNSEKDKKHSIKIDQEMQNSGQSEETFEIPESVQWSSS